jgi:hypothetical protein
MRLISIDLVGDGSAMRMASTNDSIHKATGFRYRRFAEGACSHEHLLQRK